MPVLTVETFIRAPIGRCFDLARDLDLHARSAAHTRERIVSRSGDRLVALGDVVTFEAVHLGVRQRLTAEITRFEPPYLFEDRMVRGAFRSLTHRHAFREHDGREGGGGTVMTDTVRYQSPLGPLGILADRLFLRRYLERFLRRRAAYLKLTAESRSD